MQRIETLLRKEIGLDAASIGSSVIERTLRLRMKHHGLVLAEDYDQLLSDSPEELNALIEAIVVTETWFMRGREAFVAFADLAFKEWMPRNPTGVMRVLSLPCSSGEEPFSLAMTLLEAGMSGDRFAIDAVDVSTNALVRAENAIYGKNSFRGKHLEFRDRYFVQVEDGYAISPDIQRLVKFHRGNLLRDGICAGATQYDFIFCRNLLIYFDRPTQGIALKKLHALLKPCGVLFVGPAEMPIVSECGFTSVNISHAFASRKSEVSSRKSAAKSQRSDLRPLISDINPSLSAALETDQAVSPLIIARQLADAGQFAEAEMLCQRQLLSDDTCAECYYLIGLVRDAVNDPEAINFYRKAIYLDPNHYEALVHVALLLEINGDVTRADAFKRRAERVQPKSGTES